MGENKRRWIEKRGQKVLGGGKSEWGVTILLYYESWYGEWRREKSQKDRG